MITFVNMFVLVLSVFTQSWSSVSAISVVDEGKTEIIQSEYKEGGERLDINIIDLEKNAAKVSERLRSLDKMLTKMYKDPPADGGEEFMRLSRTYNQACLDLLYFCSIDRWKAMRPAEDILEHGDPRFLDVDFDEDKIKERFKWDDEAVHGMYMVQKRTREHWYDLWHIYKKLPE